MNTSLRVAGWGTLGFAIAFFVTFAVNQALSTVIDYPRLADGRGHGRGLRWRCGLHPSVGIGGHRTGRRGRRAARGGLALGCTGFEDRDGIRDHRGRGLDPLRREWPRPAHGDAQRQHRGGGSDIASEQAVIEGLFIGVHVGGMLFAFAALPWLAMVAVGAAKHRAMSRVAVAALWIAAIGPLAGFVITGYQFGVLALLPAFAVVGASLLRNARRGGRRAVAAPPVTAAAPAAGG